MTVRGLVAGIAAVASLALAAPAGATVTIGSALGHTPNIAPNIAGGATYSQLTLPPGEAAPGGVVSPVNGTVTDYKLLNSGSSQPVSLRIVRPVLGMGSLFTGAGTSAPQLPQPGLNVVPVSLPISIGDRVGLDCCNGSSNSVTFRHVPPGPNVGETIAWTPAGTLANGAPGVAPDNTDADLQLMLAAEIEPTNAISVGKAALQGRASVIVGVSVPNPGSVTFGGGSTTPSTITVAAPGDLTVQAAVTKKARKKANKKGKLKFTTPVTFTPLYGTPNTVQTNKLKLKGKKKK